MGYVKLSKRIELWGESPGQRITVTVYWPRYKWVQNRTPVYNKGRWFPGVSATLTEQIREYKPMKTIALGDVYERPDGAFAIPVLRDGESSSCCNSGHDTEAGALQHGQEQVSSFYYYKDKQGLDI